MQFRGKSRMNPDHDLADILRGVGAGQSNPLVLAQAVLLCQMVGQVQMPGRNATAQSRPRAGEKPQSRPETAGIAF